MWRTPIVSDFKGRTPVGSKINYLLQESLWKLLLEDWTWALILEDSIIQEFKGRTPVGSNWD